MNRQLTRPALRNAALISLIAFLPSAIVVWVANQRGPLDDGWWYLDVGHALATGMGYQYPQGAWPGKPTAWRPPLWAFIESIFFRFLPLQNALSNIHVAGLAMHGVTILGTVLLVWMLSGSRRAMICAGLIVSLWPSAITAIIGGDSEPCAGAIIAAGTALVVSGGRRFWYGTLVLSLLPMVRSNFLILPFWIAFLWFVLRFRSPGLTLEVSQRTSGLLLAGMLFYIPMSAWVVRNYVTTGIFPLVASEQGAAIYGDWNAVTTTPGPAFGDWIYPEWLPGESSRIEKARTMPEVEMDRIYRRKGLQFLENHWRRIPVVMVAHVVRAILPQKSASPGRLNWKYRIPDWLFRIGIYATAIFLIIRKPPSSVSWYGLILSAGALSVMTTVLLFHGEQRFLYPLTVLLVVFVCSRFTTDASGEMPGHRRQAERW